MKRETKHIPLDLIFTHPNWHMLMLSKDMLIYHMMPFLLLQKVIILSKSSQLEREVFGWMWDTQKRLGAVSKLFSASFFPFCYYFAFLLLVPPSWSLVLASPLLWLIVTIEICIMKGWLIIQILFLWTLLYIPATEKWKSTHKYNI